MACRIIRDVDKEIVSVLAPNGEPSQLFADIVRDVIDVNKALDIYKSLDAAESAQIDNNGEDVWSLVREDYISKVDVNAQTIVEDSDLLQNLVDNGYLNCE